MRRKRLTALFGLRARFSRLKNSSLDDGAAVTPEESSARFQKQPNGVAALPKSVLTFLGLVLLADRPDDPDFRAEHRITGPTNRTQARRLREASVIVGSALGGLSSRTAESRQSHVKLSLESRTLLKVVWVNQWPEKPRFARPLRLVDFPSRPKGRRQAPLGSDSRSVQRRAWSSGRPANRLRSTECSPSVRDPPLASSSR